MNFRFAQNAGNFLTRWRTTYYLLKNCAPCSCFVMYI